MFWCFMLEYIKEALEEESFSTAKDACLHRAILASARFEASLLGAIGLSIFFLLLGEWNHFDVIDWHLLALLLPVYNISKEWKKKRKAEEEFLVLKDQNENSES